MTGTADKVIHFCRHCILFVCKWEGKIAYLKHKYEKDRQKQTIRSMISHNVLKWLSYVQSSSLRVVPKKIQMLTFIREGLSHAGLVWNFCPFCKCLCQYACVFCYDGFRVKMAPSVKAPRQMELLYYVTKHLSLLSPSHPHRLN